MGFFGAAVLVGVATVGVGVASILPVVLLGLFVMGVGDGIAAVASAGMLQRLVPDRIRGRVLGAMGSSLSAGLVCSYLVAPILVTSAGPRGVYVLGGLIAMTPLPTLWHAMRRS